MTATAQQTYTWGTGRRKTAVARVRIREGTGQFIVNDLDSKEYFPLDRPAEGHPRTAER